MMVRTCVQPNTHGSVIAMPWRVQKGQTLRWLNSGGLAILLAKLVSAAARVADFVLARPLLVNENKKKFLKPVGTQKWHIDPTRHP